MSVAVVIPFASSDPWRLRARTHVAAAYRAAGFDVVEGTCPEPWRKAVAVADAVRRTDADVLVVADADCLCGAVRDAVEMVAAGDAPWAMPHRLVHRLDLVATEAVYRGADPAGTTGRTQRPYAGWRGGGIVVITRHLWDWVPIDPRFVGWGGEDEAWADALATLVGPGARLDHDLFHLWHPPPRRISRRWGSSESKALARRYADATTDRKRMAGMVAEAMEAAMEPIS